MEQEKEIQEIEDRSLTLLETAHGIAVKDQAGYENAATFLKGVKDAKSKFVEFFAPMKKSTHAAWKAVVSKENDALDPLKEADKIVRGSMGVYLDEQDRIKREAQKALELQARKDAEAERKKLLKRADNVKTESKREELLEKAEDVVEEPVFANHAVEKTTKLDSGSVTRKKDIEVTIVDPIAFLQGIISSDIPLTCVEIKPNKVKSWVKAAGKQEDAIPGCRIRETSGVMVR
jgi:hypothetical protein